MRCARSASVWSESSSGSATRLTARACGHGNLYISATSERVKSACSAPQARHRVARALLRAGRRGDEAMGEEPMLPPETCGVNMIGVLATPGDIRRLAGELLWLHALVAGISAPRVTRRSTSDGEPKTRGRSGAEVKIANLPECRRCRQPPIVSRTFAPDGARRSCGW